MDAERATGVVALVVNSHEAVRRALCGRIKASFAHFRLREAATVAEALLILGEEPIDVVLIDDECNGVSGLQSIRAVRECSPRSSVIVMSAFDEPACRSAATRAGAMAFVSKRAIGNELMQVLADITDRRDPAPLPRMEEP